MERKNKDHENNNNQEFQFINTSGNKSHSYIKDKLEELELIADELILYAIWLWERTPQNKNIILKEIEAYLTQRIGHGSIGPATSAAEPLLNNKLKELYSFFNMTNKL